MQVGVTCLQLKRNLLGRWAHNLLAHRQMTAKSDPWLAGEPIPGVLFAHNSVVEIVSGPHTGKRGWVVTLHFEDEPCYTVEQMSGAGDVQVLQSELRAAPA